MSHHRTVRVGKDTVEKWWKLPQHKKKGKQKDIFCKCEICEPYLAKVYSRAKFKRNEDDVYDWF